MTRTHWFQARLAALLVVLGGTAATGPSYAQSPYPTRDGFVANGTDLSMSSARLSAEFDERLWSPYGLEGIAIVVDSCEPDPEVYLDGALPHYGLADAAGRQADEALVWLICFTPRYVGFTWAANNPYSAFLDDEAATLPMVAQLQAGNFSGALLDSLDVVVEQVERATLPAVARTSVARPDPIRPVEAASPRPVEPALGVVQNADNGESSRLGQALVPLLLAGGGIGALLLRRRRTVKRPAKDPWVALSERIATLREALGQESMSFARLVIASQALGDEAILELHRTHSAMRDEVERVERRSAAARGAARTMESAEAQAELEVVSAELAAIELYATQLDSRAEHAERLIENAPLMLVDVRKALEKADARLAAAAAHIELPPAAALLRFPTYLADGGEASLTDGDRLTAGRRAEDAASIVERTVGIADRLLDLDQRAQNTGRDFERLEAFALTSWADVEGNGSEAEQSLDAVPVLLERLADTPRERLGSNPMDGYAANLGVIESELDRADRLLASIAERILAIEAARDAVRPLLGELRDELVKAREWLRSPDVDPNVDPSPDVRLDRCSERLAAAERGVSESLPDWPELLRELAAIDLEIDAALADARAQAERVEALTRQSESERTAADGAVNRAHRFATSHSRDVSEAAVGEVDAARVALDLGIAAVARAAVVEDRRRVEALEQAVAHFAAALAAADAAYAAMSADFRRAEESRRPIGPRRDWLSEGFPSWGGSPSVSTGSWGSSSRQSSWGSSSGGSSSRSSGGSSSPRSSGGSSSSRSSGGSSTRRGGGRGW
jgi:hypothetical protein